MCISVYIWERAARKDEGWRDADGRSKRCSYDRRRAERHDLLVEELLQLFAADVVLVH